MATVVATIVSNLSVITADDRSNLLRSTEEVIVPRPMAEADGVLLTMCAKDLLQGAITSVTVFIAETTADLSITTTFTKEPADSFGWLFLLLLSCSREPRASSRGEKLKGFSLKNLFLLCLQL
ncbi:hypothetical protein N9L18_01395 [Candidatus Pacebacteria bacterium]|nr:hypothetical protein [Candidatus Paceibacterota bacterium]